MAPPLLPVNAECLGCALDLGNIPFSQHVPERPAAEGFRLAEPLLGVPDPEPAAGPAADRFKTVTGTAKLTAPTCWAGFVARRGVQNRVTSTAYWAHRLQTWTDTGTRTHPICWAGFVALWVRGLLRYKVSL